MARPGWFSHCFVRPLGSTVMNQVPRHGGTCVVSRITEWGRLPYSAAVSANASSPDGEPTVFLTTRQVKTLRSGHEVPYGQRIGGSVECRRIKNRTKQCFGLLAELRPSLLSHLSYSFLFFTWTKAGSSLVVPLYQWRQSLRSSDESRRGSGLGQERREAKASCY